MFGFRCVDTDQPDTLVILQDECVAIDDPNDSPGAIVFRDGLRGDNGIDLVLDAVPDAKMLQQENDDSQNDDHAAWQTPLPAIFSSQGSAFLNRTIEL